MIKVKDGYAKLIGTTYSGSADRVLLSNGGDKAVSDFAAASALGDYVTLATAQTITGAKTFNARITVKCSSSYPLIVDSTNTSENGITIQMSGVNKAWIGYTPGIGAYLYNYTGPHKIGINDSGVGFIDSNTILHSGNYTTYTVKKDGTGATGTWGINISGSADKVDGYHAGFSNNQVSVYAPFPNKSSLKSKGFINNNYGNSDYGNPDEEFLQGICKWAIDTYPNQGDITLMGIIVPNSSGTCILHLYSDSGKDSSTLLPRYCRGQYLNLSGYLYHFGTTNYVWSYNRFAFASELKHPTNYYWANVRISDTSSTITTPTFGLINSAGLVTSNRINITGTTAETAHIKFNRSSYNYITFPSDGSLAFGTDIGAANTIFRMTTSALLPETHNSVDLGTSSIRWSNIYSTNANFYGDIALHSGNEDRFLYFKYNNGDAYSWRIGYLGTGGDDANYLVLQTGGTTGSYTNALRLGLTTLYANFGGIVNAPAFTLNGASSAGTDYITGTAGRIFFGGNFHIDAVGANHLYLNHYSSYNVCMCSGSSQGRVGIRTSSPENALDVNGIQQIYQRGNDNTAFKDLLLLKQQNSTEDADQAWTSSKPTFGIGFRRYWTSGSSPYGETTCAGIYATIASSWRGGLVFRTKNNQAQGGTHDTTALRLRPDGYAVFGNSLSVAGYLVSISNDCTVSIGSQNSSYCHYETTAPRHWFNKPVYAQGDFYGGSSYNRRLAYVDELPTSLPANGGNADTVDNKHASDFKYVNVDNYSYMPNLAFYDGGSANTNYYKLSITNVNNVWTMLYVEMSIKENYNSGNYGKIVLHVNKNASNTISQFTIHTLGQLSSSVKAYANNTSSSFDIYIAGNWNWPTLNVDRITFGDLAASVTGKNITLTKVTALPSSYSTASVITGIHSSNYNSYAPKLDGTGATGTWGINISGTASNANTLDNIDSTGFLRKVTIADNVENDFNTFENMTLTGRGDPKTGASLVNAPWTGSGPAGGYGVLTYLWSGYGTQMAWGYHSNRIYIRPKYYSGSNATWSSTWDSLALTSDIPTTLKNPNALTAFGVTYDGSSAQTVNEQTLINRLSNGTSDCTDSTIMLTSHTNGWSGNAGVIYGRPASKMYNYIKGKLDSVYLPLSGGTLSGHLSSNSGYTIVQPYGAQYNTTTSSVTGCITVVLPASIGNSMVSMWIDVYIYDKQKSFSVHCGGYTYSNSTWANSPFAMVYGANHCVRMGHNGTNFVIYIGEESTVWSYPQVSVRNVTLGYSPTIANWQKAWDVVFSTSVSNVTYDTTSYVWTTKNLTKSSIDLGNVQNTAFYKRVVTVNGSSWDMAGTNSNAAFTIYAPTTAGTSGQVLTSSGGTPSWTNQSSLSVNNLNRLSGGFSVSGAGWYKLAYIKSTDARGSVRLALVTTGGNYTPRYTELKVSNGWSTIVFNQNGKFDWISKYRYTTDSTYSYIEAYFTGACDITLCTFSGTGYVDDSYSGWQVYSTATTGSGTVAETYDHLTSSSLYTSGNFHTPSNAYAAHFYENSDINLKKNIKEILDSDNIPVIKEFDWKSDGTHSYGLIAQELEEQGYSELVSDSGSHKTVNYSAALSLIVGKLQNKIKELEAEIENLKLRA